jgi:hypothetical protein
MPKPLSKRKMEMEVFVMQVKNLCLHLSQRLMLQRLKQMLGSLTEATLMNQTTQFDLKPIVEFQICLLE